MPRATVSKESKRFELKSAPPDGFVELRPMSYGELLTRRDIGAKLSIEGSQRRDAKISIDTIQTEVSWYEFRTTIVDHNLEDETGRKLNFQNRADFLNLDPQVAQEIEQLIADMNGLREEEEEALFRTDQGSTVNGPGA